MHIKRMPFVITACGFALLFGNGCGDPGGPKPPMGKVSGKVTYHGKPVTKGIVTFVPIQGKGGETGQSASGNIESDGSYSLTTFNTDDGAILGQHVATVREEFTPPPPAPGGGAGGAKQEISGQMPDFSGKTPIKVPTPTIPAKYSSVESSPLKYTVEKGNNDIPIDLKD